MSHNYLNFCIDKKCNILYYFSRIIGMDGISGVYFHVIVIWNIWEKTVDIIKNLGKTSTFFPKYFKNQLCNAFSIAKNI